MMVVLFAGFLERVLVEARTQNEESEANGTHRRICVQTVKEFITVLFESELVGGLND